ncbi:tyrosine-protein phosphatase non-receptor type 13 [Elysia marginata]|uniref:Tyrosine-protein phosphatase non-receptor type 13 n=1 Tax=Elysia marginata TaxID=1093978 RepID=A0AAV4FFA4_9GAST|nr:tyrosine-protein phosphatase non-receptor type 13 [Elysia marginata]
MPGLTSLPLNLSEILEARRGPLRELEIWALLCQCSMALQDLIIKGQVVGEDAFRHMVTPNTLLVRDNGTIQLTENIQSPQNSLYMAPEYETLSGHLISDAAFEKMFLYSLGRTLQVASEFGLQENEVLSISSDLDSLLQAMSERNAAVRLSLLQILEACCLQTNQHPDKLPHSLVLSRLYKSILGGHHKMSFNDSNYGSDHSHEAVMSHQPGRARRPRPQVRHRHARRRRGSTSTSSPNSRSRSRSRSPSRRTAKKATKPSDSRSELNSAEPGGLLYKEEPTPGATATSAHTALTGSQLLNTSMTSTSSELSLLARRQQAPPYSAAHSVQGLLGLRQGSPAYQKYIRLKERQIRRRQAKSGQTASVLDDVRSRLMTPPLLSSEMMENMSESHSMASLMSYTLGAYKPYLHAELGSEVALNFNNESRPESSSQMSNLLSSMDYGYPSVMKAHAVPGAAIQEVSQTQDMSVVGTHAVALEAPVPTQPIPHQYQSQAAIEIENNRSSLTEYYAGKQRDFDGSEYVHNLKKPAVHVPMPLQGDSLKNATLARRVTVIHLSGQKFEIVLDPSSTARQLFDTVIPYLELDDFFFFGLTYISEGEHFFLDADVKLHKVAPEGWKEGPKSHQAYVTFNLYVRVKFYPESITDFRHMSSHHLLYLQLRRDVLEERVMVDPDVLFKLAGLALQAEYGNFSSRETAAASEGHQEETAVAPYFNIEHYIPGHVSKQTGPSVADTKVRRRHKATAGITRNEAEFEFVKLAQSLPEYGIHFHKLSKSKNQSNMIWVGLSQHNMTVAEPAASAARSVTQNFAWNNILKISFNKRRFSVQPKVEGARGKPPKINFYTNSYRKGRYLLQFSAEQHRFEIRMKTLITAAETLTAGVAAVETGHHAVDSSQAKNVTAAVENSDTQTYVDPSLQKLPDDDDDDDDLDEEWDLQSTRDIEQPPQYRSWPPYQLPRMAQILGGEISPLHASLTDLHSLGIDKQHLQTLLDMSSATQGLDSVSVSDKKKTEVFTPPNLPPVTEDSRVGRRIFEVTLEKEQRHGVGITIVGGETTSSLDLGIFVKSVVPGGPAERDGRIKCGDRLIAIGATSLEGKQHHEAVAMIRDSGPKVTFLVSQVRPPGTIKRRNQSATEKEELERKLRDSMLKYSDGGFQDSGGGDEFSNQDANHMKESHLHFDHFVSNRSLHSASEDDDDECHSDEDNYPLEPPPTPPYISLSTGNQKAVAQQRFQYSQPQYYEALEQRVPSPSSPELNDLHFHSSGSKEAHLVPDMIGSPVEQPGSMQQSTIHLEDDQELLKLQDDEDLARALMKESEDWPRDDGVPSSIGYHSGPLTEEEQEDLQILGDIAALDADGSSSDSDFDSAIKKTINAPSSNIYSSSKAVNTVSPMIFKTSESQKESNEYLPNDVVYEVILEKDGSGCGIIAQPTSLEQADKGVYIQEVVQDSPADRGGVLAPGDKILEIAGQSVADKDSKTVQELMDQAPNLTTVKVSRPMEKDSAIMERKMLAEKLKNSPAEGDKFNDEKTEEQDPNVPLSALIPRAPTESTPPLEDLEIVPPPPPLNLSLENSESNTQSDVDSDVLDSSRSDVNDYHRNTETFAIHDPVPVAVPLEKKSVQDKSTPKEQPKGNHDYKNFEAEKPSRAEISSVTSDTLKLDGSTEFDEKLNELKNELDRQLATENASPNSLSKSSDSSSTESVVKSPRKILESISNKARQEDSHDEEEDEEEEADVDGEDDNEHDDDDDVIVTMYGDEPVKDKPPVVSKRKKKIPKPSADEILDPFEPVLLNVSLKREHDGFGFTVAGGVSTGGCYIKQLVSEPAMSDGRLRPGDKILQVNGQDTTSLGHVETVTLLRQLADVARLRLLRFPSTMETQQRVEAAQAQAQLASAKPQQKQGESETSEESEVKEQADISVQELVKTLDTPKAIIHPYDYKGSLMAKTGIAKQPNEPCPNEAVGQSQSQEYEEFEVTLTRPAGIEAVLGITLAQKERQGQPVICVKRLKAEGVASRDGRLRRGDVILEVNGTPFSELTVRQAVSHLRAVGETVVLSVSRSERGDASEESGDEGNHRDEQEQPQDEQGAGVDEDDDISGLAEEAVSLLQDRPASRVSEQYDSFRKPLTDVPVVLSEEWINELPLMRMAVDKGKEYSRTILQNLADLVESGEPNEAFKTIRQMKESGPCTVGNLPENKSKNRYRNVLPYDANRVKLSGRGEDKEYINASLIEMPLISYATNDTSDGEGDGTTEQSLHSNDLSTVSGKCLKYFACQGPVEGTVSDLWALLWQEQVHVVAMLTQIQEGGKLKCHPYWPRNKRDVLSVDNGTLSVRLVRSYNLQDLEVVQVMIEEATTGARQEVVLLQYKGWPDHGAPDTALPLLKLLQVIHLLENGSPPVIHCSAGIGRTGALIAIDVALACIEHGVEFNLHNIVSKLRTQRHGMVQTTDQYLFCYTACMEALLSMDLT